MDNELTGAGTGGNEPEKGGNNKKRVYIRRDVKGYILFFAAMLIVAVIVICILTLLPKKHPKVRSDGDNGLGRSFMYPFVFTDEKNSLYVLKDAASDAAAIDDTVSDAVHVTGAGTVLYVRENELYEYEISAGRRREIAAGVQNFSMTGDGAMIVFLGTDNSLRVSRGKKVSEILATQETVPDMPFVTGNSAMLYFSGCASSEGTGTLNMYTSAGVQKVLAENISYYQPYGFSGNDKYIYCSSGSKMLILDRNGNVLSEIEGGSVVGVTKQPSLYENPTGIRKFDANKPISYIFAEKTLEQNNDQSATGTGSALNQDGTLLFFNGKTVKTIAENVRKGIYASADHSLIIFTVPDGDGERICRGDKKGNVEKLIYVEDLQRCLYDPETNNLYYQTKGGMLYRFNIYSSALETTLISEVSANLYKYPEKPFVMFSVPETDIICLVFDNGSVEQYKADEQIRMYGADTDKYVLLRGYGYGSISLDLADGEYYKRIAGTVDPVIIFDNLLKNVLYVSDGKLYVWNGSESREAGQFGQIRAADIG